MKPASDERVAEVRSYATGFVFALLLTGIAFALVHWPTFTPITTLAIVFGLALVQLIVHFRFFLHVRFDRASLDDLQLVLFSTLIIALMVSGTLVLMFNLRGRMM